jgi:radical SAM protein with 4Fe4S-binding SPASM domain
MNSKNKEMQQDRDCKGSRFGFRSKDDELFPPMLIVNTTYLCNAKCLHCPHPTVIATRKYPERPLMGRNIYLKVVTEASKYKTLFRFSAFGEPLTHPQAVEMVELAKEMGCQTVSLNTNGELLSADKSERLLRSSIDVIEISLDAFSEGVYRKVRCGLDFEKVQRNLHDLLELREKLGKNQTKVMVSFVEQPESSHEVKPFEEYWTPRVDRVLIRKFLSFSGIKETSKETQPYYRKRIPCPYAWRRMSVDPFGNIRLCIDDWLDKGIIGNVNENSIHELWTGKLCNEWRQAHLDGSYHKIEKCRTCTDWRFHSWELNYFKALEEIEKAP